MESLQSAYQDTGIEANQMTTSTPRAEVQAAHERIKANHIKTSLKKLFAEIDSARSGFVKIKIFEQLLGLNKVTLLARDMARLIQEAKENRPNSEMIEYKKALRLINPNPELENSVIKPWMLILNTETFSKIDQDSQRSVPSRTF